MVFFIRVYAWFKMENPVNFDKVWLDDIFFF